MYVPLDHYYQFIDLSDFQRNQVSDQLIAEVRKFHESDDLEELLLRALSDPNRTPHGPVEIVDIMTQQLSFRKKEGVAGFILKGRSFQSISPADISHQVFRLRKISDLQFAVLGYVGNLLDQAREEFIHTAEDLDVDYTIIDAVDFARLAVIFGKLCPRDARRINNGRCNCGYRVRGENTNILQQEALFRLRETHEIGIGTGLVIMPTGSGKTRIASIDSRRFNADRVLYVAHTHEILDGAEKEFAHFYGVDAINRGWEIPSGIPRPSVHLSTIQSISHNIDAASKQDFDYIVIDEFHHVAAKSYQQLIKRLQPRFLLGLTATPFRGDRQDVAELCNGNIIVNFELRVGIDSGILVPYYYFGCFDDIDYGQISRTATGYHISDLNKRLIIPERDEAIIAKWCEQAINLPTLAFCCSQKHAIRMSEAFNKKDIAAAPYLGTTPLTTRAGLVEKLQYGDLKILCTVDVLNEGVDIPFVECLLFLRPTESKRIFFQQLGRGLRRNPGKERIIVLDFIGNFYNAYRIVEYLGLEPEEQIVSTYTPGRRSSRDVVNLPIGCKVAFDDRVIDVFASQVFDPKRAKRDNIAQILIYLYRRTSKKLGRPATKKEVDRLQLLNSDFYKMVFGSWPEFQKIMVEEDT